MSDWDVNDFAAWEYLSGDYAHLFQLALKNKLAICLPPDCSIVHLGSIFGKTGPKAFEEFMKWHLLVPDKKFQNRFRSYMNKDACVDVQGPQGEYLRMHGSGWGKWAQTLITAVKEQTINAVGGNTIRVFMLTRAFTTPALSLQIANPAIFGQQGDHITEAVDYLARMDPNHTLMTKLNKEVAHFRNSYTVLDGFEKELFEKIEQVLDRVQEEAIQYLQDATVSAKRQHLSTQLAVESYVHSQVYQRTFPCVMKVCVAAEEQLSNNLARLQAQRVTTVQLGVENDALSARKDSAGGGGGSAGGPTSNRGVDYSPVAAAMDMISIGTNPFDKLQYLAAASDAIAQCVPKQLQSELSADAMLPLLAFCIVYYGQGKNLVAHLKYLETFESAILEDSELEYTFVSFQAAVDLLMHYEFENDGADVEKERDDGSLPSSVATRVMMPHEASPSPQRPRVAAVAAQNQHHQSSGSTTPTSASFTRTPLTQPSLLVHDQTGKNKDVVDSVDDFDEDEYERQKLKKAAVASAARQKSRSKSVRQ